MFGQATIHRGLAGNSADLGLLAETLLFYNDVVLLLDYGSLALLLEALDHDTIVRLTTEFGVKVSYHRQSLATAMINLGGVQANAFMAVSPNGKQKNGRISIHDELLELIERKHGETRQSRKLAKHLLEVISIHQISPKTILDLSSAATKDLLDSEFGAYAAKETIIQLAPSAGIDSRIRFSILDLGNEGFIIDSNIDFRKLADACHSVTAQLDGAITAQRITTNVLSARLDSYFAASYMSSYVCDPISSSLIRHRFLDLVRRRDREASDIDLFQERILPDGCKIREAINSGDVSFQQFLIVLSAARKFKQWLHGLNPDESLLSEYLSELKQTPWIASLPGKTFRWITTAGLGLAFTAISNPVVGGALTVGLGAADTFLVERLLKGWRPDQFVEGPLSAVVNRRHPA
jgi:hypothetical protein